ncbi:MAG: sulfate reduction electron transfer complex DsrMKJOP subunit DsrO [Nitrospirota bacterium]
MDRRTFLKIGGGVALGTAIAPLPQLVSLLRAEDTASGKTKLGMVIDLSKCKAGCTVCVDACRKENNVPPDNYWLRVANIKPKFPNALGRPIPLLCNHCEDPFCVKVCLVKASFKRKDGIVLIDEHRCIGCRYCMIVCPYKARSFVFKKTDEWTNPDVPNRMHGVVEKCDFCVHRIDKGLMPACVEACPEKAMVFGNLNDPQSEVAKLIVAGKTQRIRPDLGSKPKVYYLGL